MNEMVGQAQNMSKTFLSEVVQLSTQLQKQKTELDRLTEVFSEKAVESIKENSVFFEDPELLIRLGTFLYDNKVKTQRLQRDFLDTLVKAQQLLMVPSMADNPIVNINVPPPGGGVKSIFA